jgi:hypothetical protein
MTKKHQLNQPNKSQCIVQKAVDQIADQSSAPNRPRNLLITDATQPFTFSFQGRFALYKSILIHQTAAEETWPGGALWDLGVLLAEVLVALSAAKKSVHVTLTTSTEPNKTRGINRSIDLPGRVWCGRIMDRLKNIETNGIILELGAGVGLTGLVASSTFNAKLTVITDLEVVVDKVTTPNLAFNSTAMSTSKLRVINKGTGQVVAMPLCWGNLDDEAKVADTLRSSDLLAKASVSSKRKSKPIKQDLGQEDQAQMLGMPSLVLIGDVAYQHRPGAPSHFEALLSTLLKFTGPQTLVLFGTRMRMPASNDLLNAFLDHFDELVEPPLVADELDSSFAGLKHNMSIHFLQLKSKA